MNEDTILSAGNEISATVISDFGLFDETPIQAAVRKAKINLSEDCPAPPVFLSVTDGVTEYPLLHIDALSLFIGKPKSRKTFVVLLFIAMIIAKKVVAKNIIYKPIPGKTVVIVFDTEMAKWRVHRSAKRIQNLSGNFDECNLEVYGLRGLDPEQRIAVIEYVLQGRTDILLVAIDGIRDLLYDINSPIEATQTLTKLTKWCADFKIHIIAVLHQNKGDLNARGHQGAEGVNKADVVLTISKSDDNPEISIVEPSHSRDQDFPAFAIGINSQGLPYVVEDWQPEAIEAPKKYNKTPFDYPPATHDLVLNKVFDGDRRNTLSEFKEYLKASLSSLEMPCGDTKVKFFITYYTDTMKWVEQTGTPKSKESRYRLIKSPG